MQLSAGSISEMKLIFFPKKQLKAKYFEPHSYYRPTLIPNVLVSLYQDLTLKGTNHRDFEFNPATDIGIWCESLGCRVQ